MGCDPGSAVRDRRLARNPRAVRGGTGGLARQSRAQLGCLFSREIRMAPAIVRRLLLHPGSGHNVFTRKCQSHVPRPARRKYRYSRVSGATARTGLQHHVHVGVLAGRQIQRPLLALGHSRRRLPSLRHSLFCLRTRALTTGDLAGDGLLWTLLCAHQCRTQGTDCRKRGHWRTWPSARDLFVLRQRDHAALERHHRSTVEDLWTSGPVLFFSRDRDRLGIRPASPPFAEARLISRDGACPVSTLPTPMARLNSMRKKLMFHLILG